ncbi:hypothetical protein [Microbacterium aurum]
MAAAREVPVHGGEDSFDTVVLGGDTRVCGRVSVRACGSFLTSRDTFGLQLCGGGDLVRRDRLGDEPGEPAEWMPLLVDVDVAGHARSESVDVLEQLVHRPASLDEAVTGHGVTDVPDVLTS